MNLACADAARLQKAADLSATLIARLNSIKATASPAEAARIKAELPQLQRGQQDLQAGIDHINSYADQAGAVANDTTEGVQAVGGSTASYNLPTNTVSPGAPGSPQHMAARWQEYQAKNAGNPKAWDMSNGKSSMAGI